MGYNVTLIRKLTPRSKNEFKRYAKDVSLPIPPIHGMIVDRFNIDNISVDTESNTVICYTDLVTFGGDDEAFDKSCEEHVLSGWKRI
jgi:hypothetical protein